MSMSLKLPLNFIQKTDQNHLLLFYDDQKYAREIQSEFLKKGLKNNEICFFVTKNSLNAEMELKHAGIDFENHIVKNQLKILQVPDSFTDISEYLEKTLLENINPETPTRIVGDKVFFSNEQDDFKEGCNFEQSMHETFPNFNGSILCSYDVSSINDNKRSEIVSLLFSQHHAVITAPKVSKGTSFYL